MPLALAARARRTRGGILLTEIWGREGRRGEGDALAATRERAGCGGPDAEILKNPTASFGATRGLFVRLYPRSARVAAATCKWVASALPHQAKFRARRARLTCLPAPCMERIPQDQAVVQAMAYLRTSSAANVGIDKDSEKRQRAAIEAFAAARGFELVGEFYDAAVSGADPVHECPGFTAMLARIASNGARCIIVESPDRKRAATGKCSRRKSLGETPLGPPTLAARDQRRAGRARVRGRAHRAAVRGRAGVADAGGGQVRLTHQRPAGASGGARVPTNRELSRPSSAPKVVYFGIPGVILSVLRGLHERLATRHVDCVDGAR